MITRRSTSLLLSSIPRFATPSTQLHICVSCRRSLHRHVNAGKVPEPTPFVPDVETFLTLIGRELSKHSSKFKSWTELFTLSSTELKELGIEPPRSRKYLLAWREKFKKGQFGIGGDLQFVQDGVAELRVVEVPSIKKAAPGETQNQIVSTSQSPGMTRLIVNVPNGSSVFKLEEGQTTADLKKPTGFTLRKNQSIVGSYVQPIKGTKGTGATLKVQEGMWEDRRGHKVHGGERRRAETLHKLRIAERKKNER